jgi:hypothetical protein
MFSTISVGQAVWGSGGVESEGVKLLKPLGLEKISRGKRVLHHERGQE